MFRRRPSGSPVAFCLTPPYTLPVPTLLGRASRGVVDVYPALGHRAFVLYWTGTLISLTGFWMQVLAQNWLVLMLTGSPLMLGLVGAVWAAPNLALSLVGGALADRVDRRRLLVATRTFGAVAALTIAALVFTGVIQVWHVFLIAGLMGVVSAFDMPTSQALVPSLVGTKHLASAIALISAAFNGTRIVGPSVAGVMVATVGIGGCYLVSGVAALSMVGALLVIRAPSHSVGRSSGLFRHVREGLGYVQADDVKVTLLGLLLLSSLFGMAYPTMLPLFARDVFGAGPEGYGALMTATGVGSLGGTLVVATFTVVRGSGRLVIGALIAFGVTLVAFASSQSFVLSLALMAVVGLANAVFSTLATTLLQGRLDDEYRGRVMSVFSLVMSAMPLAGLQAGAIASAFGAPTALAVNGLVVAIGGGLVALFVPSIRRV